MSVQWLGMVIHARKVDMHSDTPRVHPPLLSLMHTPMDRRAWLRQCFWQAGACSLSASGVLGASAHAATVSPWTDLGPLQAPDANGLRLPAGLVSRVVGVSGERPFAGASRVWHTYPDGGATFPVPGGGWIYVSNSEIPLIGGVGALRFSAQGAVVGYERVLTGTSTNCAGGVTPWGTWLSCEETLNGRVWEVSPQGPASSATPCPALGLFDHEAIAVDPANKTLYMTEDTQSGRFYRFVCSPQDWPAGAARPALKQGRLQVLQVRGLPNNTYPGESDTGFWATPKGVEWVDVASPRSPQLTVRTFLGSKAPGSIFKGGEGLWFSKGVAYFSTKGDNRIWALDVVSQTLYVIYDFATAQVPNNALSGVDNLTLTPWGDLLVAEDGGNLELCNLKADGSVQVLVQVTGQDKTELTGPAFSPDGQRLYFSSQRGGPRRLGITYEIRRA